MASTNSASIKFSIDVPQLVIREWFDGVAKVEAARKSRDSEVSSFVKQILEKILLEGVSNTPNYPTVNLTGSSVKPNVIKLGSLSKDDIIKKLEDCINNYIGNDESSEDSSYYEGSEDHDHFVEQHNLVQQHCCLKEQNCCADEEPEVKESNNSNELVESVDEVKQVTDPFKEMFGGAGFKIPEDQLNKSMEMFGSLFGKLNKSEGEENGDVNQKEGGDQLNQLFGVFGSLFSGATNKSCENKVSEEPQSIINEINESDDVIIETCTD